MTHSLPLLTTIATALAFALILGFIAVKIKLPALVGYLLAGIIIGPFTPGVMANIGIAAELAEVGVMLLMFGVGLHFSVDHLLEMRHIALPGALIQIIVATCLGCFVALSWGWSLGAALVFGLALSVASTVVLVRALEAHGLLGSINGQIAVSWLIVEDMAMVFVLVFLPLLAQWLGTQEHSISQQNLWLLLLTTLLKITAFFFVMVFIGRWLIPKVLWHIARTGSRELFTLCIIVAAVSIAFGVAKLFGMSFALGAFFSGMIMRESKFSRRAAEESLPLRDAFAVLFFVSVGMLFNPAIFIDDPMHVIIVVGIIIIGKSIAAAALVLCFGYSLTSALIVSASLAQIGEFSFILAALGVQLNLLPHEGQELILAGALISISINPLLFKLINPLEAWMRTRSSTIRALEASGDPLMELPMDTEAKYLSGQVILVGYGRVGRRVGRILKKQEIPFVIIEEDHGLVEKLRKKNYATVYGDAAEPFVLIQAHVFKAGMLVITPADSFNARHMINTARKINPNIEIALRAPNEEVALLLKDEMPARFFFHEKELARGISDYVLERFGVRPD